MKSAAHRLLAGILVLVTGCASGPPPVASQAPSGVAEQQILVMVKESAVRHYRPGPASFAGYDSAASRARSQKVAESLVRDYDLKLVSDWAMPALGVRCFLVELAPGQTPVEMAQRLSADPRVESAQPQHLFHVSGHDDPYYPLQTGAQELQLDALHRMATGKGIKVAQIDTGVDARHPDLAGQMSAERNFVDGPHPAAEVHGTAVAGIIVARADNGIGIVGVAPGAKLIPLRACWENADGRSAVCSSFTIAKAMQFALIERVRVINLSLTGPYDRLLERLIDSATQDKIAVVAALDPAAPGFPATDPAVIAVAVDGSANVPENAILAPGRDILTTTPGASWGFFSGASFAAAHMSGFAALMLERSPALKPDALQRILLEHQSVAAAEGMRVLDACAALAEASGARDCGCCSTAAARRVRGRSGMPAS
ncbi:MAG TPA: S8 family serine peptidase [Burkholderiales bacterium]|nr:S8 family serine peptidase [Burkholderiales bacterium]